MEKLMFKAQYLELWADKGMPSPGTLGHTVASLCQHCGVASASPGFGAYASLTLVRPLRRHTLAGFSSLIVLLIGRCFA